MLWQYFELQSELKSCRSFGCTPIEKVEGAHQCPVAPAKVASVPFLSDSDVNLLYRPEIHRSRIHYHSASNTSGIVSWPVCQRCDHQPVAVAQVLKAIQESCLEKVKCLSCTPGSTAHYDPKAACHNWGNSIDDGHLAVVSCAGPQVSVLGIQHFSPAVEAVSSLVISMDP